MSAHQDHMAGRLDHPVPYPFQAGDTPASISSVGGRPLLSFLRHGLRPVAIAVAVTLFGLAGTAGGWAFYLQQTGNFHVVEPDMVYRSGTLGETQLEDVLRDNGIKSIINLRGGSDEEDWYRVEGETAKALGIVRIDLPMSDSMLPSAATLASLVEALENSPKPVLIHCKAGADRTGLAAALYEYLIAHKPADIAAEQLSFFYGHFPWYPSHTGAMDQAFWNAVH